MSDESKPEVPEDETKRWWLCCAIMGRQHILEIVSVHRDTKNSHTVPIAAEPTKVPPDFGPDDEIIVDRGITIAQVMGPSGQGQAYVDFRAGLGPIFMAPNNDYSKKENRRPIHFKGRSLMIGPYLWMDFEDEGEQFLKDQIQAIYSPVETLDKPAIVGADGNPIGGRPGAMGAIGQFGP